MLTIRGGPRDGDQVPFVGRTADIPDVVTFQRLDESGRWIVDYYARVDRTLVYEHASQHICGGRE